MSKRTGSKACTVRAADIAFLNATLDQIRDSDPLAALSRCLMDSGVTEEELAKALKQRGSEPIAVAMHNAFRDVSRGVPTTNKWGVTCKLPVKEPQAANGTARVSKGLPKPKRAKKVTV